MDEITKHAQPREKRAHCRFSILIPTWNNLAMLQLCIKSIRQHSTFAHQIILHVNEGTDGTLEWVKKQPDIDYTYSATNRGICYPMNAAATLACTDYIVYINDDMYVLPEWDKVFWDEIQSIGHSQFFLSGSAIEPPEVAKQNPCVIKKNYGDDLASFQEDKLLAEFASLPFADWSGSSWPPSLVPKALWDEVGGYSIEFSPGAYSDADFSMKLWHAGVRYFKGLSASRVYHFGSKSVKRARMNKGRGVFTQKWGISAKSYDILYIRNGQPFTGPLPEVNLGTWDRLVQTMKKSLFLFSGTP